MFLLTCVYRFKKCYFRLVKKGFVYLMLFLSCNALFIVRSQSNLSLNSFRVHAGIPRYVGNSVYRDYMNGVAQFDLAYYRQINSTIHVGVFGHVMHSKADFIKLNRKFDARLDMGAVGVSLGAVTYLSDQVGVHATVSSGLVNTQARFGLVDSVPTMSKSWDYPFVKLGVGLSMKMDEYNEVLWELTASYFGGESRIEFPENYTSTMSENRLMIGFGLTYLWRLHKVTSDDFLE